MSPVMDNFVHSLVEMAKAMEELPQVQDALEKSTTTIEQQGHMIASREESIMRLKADIETLQAKVRDAEASRDDAELRFLELDEKAGKVLRVLAAVQSDATAATELLSPPKPEPVPEPTPEPLQPQADPSPAYVPGSFSNPLPGTEPAIQPAEGMAWTEYNPKPYDYYDAQGRGQYWVRNEVGQFASVQRAPDPTPAATVASEQPTAIPTEPIASTDTAPPTSTQGQSEPLPSSSNTYQTSTSPVPSTNTESPTTASLPVAESQASAPVDDVGYHNEPAKYTQDWYRWAGRMDSRYGFSKWPSQDAAQ